MTDNRLQNGWDAGRAATLTEAEKLLYRSNLLGSDKRITNYGGGNTSAKVMETDPLTGEQVEVLWVKGSGGDVGSIRMDGFATLYMDKLRALKDVYRGPDHEDEMVGYLPHCTFNLNPRAASIDTPLHAYVPFKHVDHMHPDAIIAIAAARDSRALTQTIFGDEIGWLPWRRPGYELGLWLSDFCAKNPQAKGVVLESHGLFTWADDAQECYALTLQIIQQAMDWFAAETTGKSAFGGAVHQPLDGDARRTTAARLMPVIRGLVSGDHHMVGHFDDSAAVLEFVNARDMPDLAALGTSCPDHFLRTKIRPLVVAFDPAENDLDGVIANLPEQVAAYRKDYATYYDRCKHDNSPPLRDPNPVIFLVPGVGMISFAKDKATARISSEFYVNAINVMRGASSVSTYVGLPEQEAFDIEYWLLEEAKLQRMPKPKSLAGRVALVTGGAGGIGTATADRYLREGACVMLADIDADALERTRDVLAGQYGADVVRTQIMDVTDEDAVAAAYAAMAVEFGGVDILVSNAGIASSAPVEETSLALWNRNMDILSTGYFLVSREAFRAMRVQGMGGAIVFVASKNGLAASPNASAYCTAKAAEIHLARCLALEGAEAGIRVNVVNPDAVLRGSKIWSGEWLDQRASTYGTDKGGLEEMYRQRSMLKRSVLPEDIAEAAYFLASDLSSKSTGNILNVDAGNVQAFTR
ncbi:bifunctional rhamnulose-1-phosphate aldolase/short-chain dehydrogenase [Roseinatronobacter alkalisoli]|uniref:Bifunctional rhamnulose-1-phosphate aldolase/short-chain dehydrogenase n=1 Tax=Roseinatronobacter alkalisoli TaxID=3028235 RepID=A0ABT5TAR9_9RHOB|nr:bifunctional rhamnulose-1-phosphate aldolase/short-chain dehydrogenase [Roseinatronobacter sp. HJB301]MDD7972218.1 bifunctional rhamnulose-1-phosphate aldolase/short-chain dehydrogenase [Roseinatronobacter sp. HJB301]